LNYAMASCDETLGLASCPFQDLLWHLYYTERHLLKKSIA
jgi:hypothetical protein